MISTGDAGWLAAAGVLAGIAGTAGGITTLVSFPALLAVGVPALAANVVNVVAGVACWPGSALASRPELAGRAAWLRPWVLVTTAGAAAGAGLLLSTSSGVFNRVVPFLVLGAALALLAQPWLTANHGHRLAGGRPVLLAGGLLVVSAYNGYFGAGAGVMTLALVLLLVDQHLARANALKNMLIGAASVVSAGLYIVFGSVQWRAVVPLAAGMFVGGLIGPRVTRRLPEGVLRTAVVLLGIGLAIRLWIDPA